MKQSGKPISLTGRKQQSDCMTKEVSKCVNKFVHSEEFTYCDSEQDSRKQVYIGTDEKGEKIYHPRRVKRFLGLDDGYEALLKSQAHQEFFATDEKISKHSF